MRRFLARLSIVSFVSFLSFVANAEVHPSGECLSEPIPGCGGGRVTVSCECGQEVKHSWAMDAADAADLSNCPGGVGIFVQTSNVVINGNGFMIHSSVIASNGEDSYGVYIKNSPDKVQISNLRISGFRHGIRILNGTNTKLTNIETHDNITLGDQGYGIDVAGGSNTTINYDAAKLPAGVTDLRCDIYDNGDEGVHLGGNSSNSLVQGCWIHENGLENLYLEQSDDNEIFDNDTWGSSGGVDVKVDGSQGNHFAGNIFRGNVQFRDFADSNDFGKSGDANPNYIIGGRLQFKGFTVEDSLKGFTVEDSPVSNSVYGALVSGKDNYCIVFDSQAPADVPAGNTLESSCVYQCNTNGYIADIPSHNSGGALENPPGTQNLLKNNNINTYNSHSEPWIDKITTSPRTNCPSDPASDPGIANPPSS